MTFAGNYTNCIAIKVDRNHSYAVFVSYAEVYNEKVNPVSLNKSVAPS